MSETATRLADEYLDAGSATARAHAEASALIPGGTSRVHYHFGPYPIRARSGEGCWLIDAEGTRRLDCLNNMTSLIHGHAHPAVKAAVVDQLERGTAFSEPSDEEARLAALMVERVASVERIRFSNSGTEAVMFAIKLARAHTGRSKLAKFASFYHGYYDYVQIGMGRETEGLADSAADEVIVLPYGDPAALERTLAERGHEIAALITDPLSNQAGFPLPEPSFLRAMEELTRKHGVVLIYDEVISFRLGYRGAQGTYGGRPDLTTFGKIIGGGLPVGAVGGRAEIMALLDPTDGPPRVISGGTFSANPLTMAAGHAAMTAWTEAEVTRMNGLGARLRSEGERLLKRAGVEGSIAGDGSLFRITPSGLAKRLHRGLLERGVIVSVTGLGCLSTAMGEREVDLILEALEGAVSRIGPR